jgi:tetratricopeptide (TPR) repeat protein
MLKGFFYDRIRASRKAELHRRLAERYENLEEAGALDGMYHYVRAKKPEKAAGLASVYGEAYLAKGHVSDMLSIAEGIVSGMKRPSAEALILCGLARLASANVPGATAALEEALSILKGKGGLDEAKANLELAKLYDWIGQLGPAFEHSDAGFELASKLKDKGLVCRSLGITGRICAHTGRIKDAVRFLDLCVDGAQGDLRQLAAAYMDQGNLCIVTGDLPKAIKLLDKALVGALRAKDELTLITALDLLGWANHLKGEDAKALNYFAREISLIEGCAFRLQLPMAHCNAGLSYLGQGKKDKAMDRLTKAKELGAGLGCARLDARTSDGLGTLHSLRKEWDKAEACFEDTEKALAISRDPWALGSHHMLVGDLNARKGKRRESREE